MVLTKAELVASLRDEVRILLHLAGKIDRAQLDYRPTPKQRSTLELLQYLSFMGPQIIEVAKSGSFDTDAWTKAEEAARARDFDQTLAVIAEQADLYAAALDGVTDADLRGEVAPFGETMSRGRCLVTWLLSGCAAYRMQLFLYLKACGRDLNTMNLWSGVDSAQ